MDELLPVTDVFASIEDVLASEMDNLKPIELEHFMAYTEGYKPKGEVFYNMTNLVCLNREDYEYYRYYVRKEDWIAEMTFPTYDLNIFVLAHFNSAVLTNALKKT